MKVELYQLKPQRSGDEACMDRIETDGDALPFPKSALTSNRMLKIL